MESSSFFGGSVIAAVVAGMLALFAPCCISFMLPAYFASSFQNRLRLVAMTFLFAAGVATIILPIALGALVLRQLFAAQHTTIYVVGGVLLLGLAIYLLFGGQIHLPMPGRSAGGKAGAVTTYTLGIFSGITSSCCAPVLAGVIALSSVASSFLFALGLGTAYVFGRVAPLFVISLLWERYDWKSSRLFHPRSFTLKQKVADEGISTPILSDPTFAVSQAYHATQYGMMNGSSDGHTFIIVGPAGRIIWRADYGGPPNYTMYVPISRLLADMKEGLHGRSS